MHPRNSYVRNVGIIRITTINSESPSPVYTTKMTKKFDAVTVFIDEDKHIAIAQIRCHPVVHNAAQHMKALTHVGWLCEQPVPHAVI